MDWKFMNHSGRLEAHESEDVILVEVHKSRVDVVH